MNSVTEKIFTEYQKLMDNRLSSVEIKIDKIEDALGALPKQLADEIDNKYARKEDVKDIKKIIDWTMKFVILGVLGITGVIILKAVENGWIN